MFVNLTPHTIVIVAGEAHITIAPSGAVARVASRSEVVGEVDGVTVTRQVLGAVEGLPPFDENVTLLVSAMVRAAEPDRADLMSPGELVRNEAGQPIGCRNLIANCRRGAALPPTRDRDPGPRALAPLASAGGGGAEPVCAVCSAPAGNCGGHAVDDTVLLGLQR